MLSFIFKRKKIYLLSLLLFSSLYATQKGQDYSHSKKTSEELCLNNSVSTDPYTSKGETAGQTPLQQPSLSKTGKIQQLEEFNSEKDDENKTTN